MKVLFMMNVHLFCIFRGICCNFEFLGYHRSAYALVVGDAISVVCIATHSLKAVR